MNLHQMEVYKNWMNLWKDESLGALENALRNQVLNLEQAEAAIKALREIISKRHGIKE